MSCAQPEYYGLLATGHSMDGVTWIAVGVVALPLVLGPCKLNVPVGTGSKLCICFLHGKVAMLCLSQGLHSERLFSSSVIFRNPQNW